MFEQPKGVPQPIEGGREILQLVAIEIGVAAQDVEELKRVAQVLARGLSNLAAEAPAAIERTPPLGSVAPVDGLTTLSRGPAHVVAARGPSPVDAAPTVGDQPRADCHVGRALGGGIISGEIWVPPGGCATRRVRAASRARAIGAQYHTVAPEPDPGS